MFQSRLLMGALGLLLAATLSSCSPRAVHPSPGSPSLEPLIDRMHLVFIPAGQFGMGNTYDRGVMPLHRVLLRGFWMDRTEVSNAEYGQCVAEGVCQPPTSFSSYTRSEYFGNPTYAAYPVIYVSWDDANSFCRWAGGRLPTEAEWEHAARGEAGGMYPWGDQPPTDSLSNFGFGVGDTSPVGNYPSGASPYGVLDMAGNVAEWVADWFENDYYSLAPLSDPMGPGETGAHVVRGGSWLDNAIMVRSDLRLGYPPDSAYVNLGFRCAESAQALPGLAGAAGGTILR